METIAIATLKQDILNYYASMAQGKILGLRDFNAMLLSRTFDASPRDALRPAIDALVGEGLLVACSATEYTLTKAGEEAAREARRQVTARIAAQPGR